MPGFDFALEEIREESLQQGMQQGVKVGRAEGIQQGIQQGHEKEKQEVVSNMLKKGVELSFISKVMNLPLEKLKEFKKKGRFTWDVIKKIEEEVIEKEEERIMPRLLSAMEKAKKESLQQGIQQGVQVGRAEGIQLGIQQGQQKEKQEIVLDMLKKDVELSFISEMTRLSPKEIKKLQNGG